MSAVDNRDEVVPFDAVQAALTQTAHKSNVQRNQRLNKYIIRHEYYFY